MNECLRNLILTAASAKSFQSLNNIGKILLGRAVNTWKTGISIETPRHTMKATQLLNISPQIGSMNGGKVELTSATITGKKYEN